MKPSDLRQKPVEELRQERVALLREIFNLRMQRAMGQLKKPHLFRQARVNIARINSILAEKTKQP